MSERDRANPPEPRYRAMPFKRNDDNAWMLCDTVEGRIVMIPIHKNAAQQLAHTLNVAELSEPLTDDGSGR